jgi:hypothetical protein
MGDACQSRTNLARFEKIGTYWNQMGEEIAHGAKKRLFLVIQSAPLLSIIDEGEIKRGWYAGCVVGLPFTRLTDREKSKPGYRQLITDAPYLHYLARIRYPELLTEDSYVVVAIPQYVPVEFFYREPRKGVIEPKDLMAIGDKFLECFPLHFKTAANNGAPT